MADRFCIVLSILAFGFCLFVLFKKCLVCLGWGLVCLNRCVFDGEVVFA